MKRSFRTVVPLERASWLEGGMPLFTELPRRGLPGNWASGDKVFLESGLPIASTPKPSTLADTARQHPVQRHLARSGHRQRYAGGQEHQGELVTKVTGEEAVW